MIYASSIKRGPGFTPHKIFVNIIIQSLKQELRLNAAGQGVSAFFAMNGNEVVKLIVHKKRPASQLLIIIYVESGTY